MQPPDGLISQLRNTARMLMSALYWAQKCQLDGFKFWPVDVNQMLGSKRVALPDDMPSIDGKDAPAIDELKPLCSILRRQIVNEGFLFKQDGSPAKGYYEYDVSDLEALKSYLNLPIEKADCGYVAGYTSRPCHLISKGPTLRILADMLMDFTFMLVSDYGITGKRPVYGLHEHNPIAVCRHCDGLFIRTRSDGEYCSVKCRSTAWSESRGKEYFAQKQRESRAAKRKQREAKKKKSMR